MSDLSDFAISPHRIAPHEWRDLRLPGAIRIFTSAEQDLLDIIDFGINHDLPDPLGFIARLRRKIALLDTPSGKGRDRYGIGLLVFELPVPRTSWPIV